MTHRELHVTRTDGRETIEATDRDDRRGRANQDAAAFRFLEDADVTAARSVPVSRIATTTGRRTYR